MHIGTEHAFVMQVIPNQSEGLMHKNGCYQLYLSEVLRHYFHEPHSLIYHSFPTEPQQLKGTAAFSLRTAPRRAAAIPQSNLNPTGNDLTPNLLLALHCLNHDSLTDSTLCILQSWSCISSGCTVILDCFVPSCWRLAFTLSCPLVSMTFTHSPP